MGDATMIRFIIYIVFELLWGYLSQKNRWKLATPIIVAVILLVQFRGELPDSLPLLTTTLFVMCMAIIVGVTWYRMSA